MRTTGILLNVALKPFEPLIGHIATAEIKVRAGAVLPGSGGAEHQATSAVPQPTDNTYYGSYGERKNSMAADNRFQQYISKSEQFPSLVSYDTG